MELTPENQGKKKSRLLLGVGIAIIVVLILIGAMYAIIAATKSKAPTADSGQSAAAAAVTQQDINGSKADLDEAVKKSQADHTTAEAAVTNLSKPTKVSK